MDPKNQGDYSPNQENAHPLRHQGSCLFSKRRHISRAIPANVKATPLISLGTPFIWITLMFLGPIPLYVTAFSKVKVIR